MENTKIFGVVIAILILIAISFFVLTMQMEKVIEVSIPFCIQKVEVIGGDGTIPTVGITIETLESNEWMTDCCALLNENSSYFQLFCPDGSPCYNKTCFIRGIE